MKLALNHKSDVVFLELCGRFHSNNNATPISVTELTQLLCLTTSEVKQQLSDCLSKGLIEFTSKGRGADETIEPGWLITKVGTNTIAYSSVESGISYFLDIELISDNLIEQWKKEI